MDVTIITKDADERYVHHFRAGVNGGGAAGFPGGLHIAVLVGEPSTLCGGFFTYWAT
jgi:hypothetical protein